MSARDLDVDVDARARRLHDRHPGEHVASLDAALAFLTRCRKLCAVVDAEQQRRIGSCVRRDLTAGGTDQRQYLGQIDLAGNRRDAREQLQHDVAGRKRRRRVLTSRIASTSALTSSVCFVSTTRSIAPSASRTTRPYPLGSATSIVTIVAAAPRARMRRGELAQQIRVDERHVAGRDDQRHAACDQARGREQRSARPVGMWLYRDCARRPSQPPRVGASAATTRITSSAPASRAAATGQPTSGRPQRSCTSFGLADRIRVPRPAARITTVPRLTA